ncbi:MAG: 1-(5-phosphoribosyl)-5-[(5-phosphoribosylamino)methylideneamino]imidazole-4-carboxamide isomerase [Woeseiaceae bacterium]
MKLIPAIDLIGGQCVRLFKGRFDKQTNYDKDPVALARVYEAAGCSDLHIVDLDGARSGEQENATVIDRIVNGSGLDVQIGGGIRKESEVELWLDAGVARVVIGSLAVTNSEQVCDWLQTYGPEKIVLALDVTIDGQNAPLVATHGWTRSGDMTLWQCLDLYLPVGLRHVLCTDTRRDGAMIGPNVDLYREVLQKYPNILLQASGGIRDVGDLALLQQTGVPAAISGRALLDGKITNEELGRFLRAA